MSLEVLDKTQITKEFFEAFPTIKLREQGSFLLIANPAGLNQDDSNLLSLYRYLLIHPEIKKLDLSNNHFNFEEEYAEIINGIFQRLSYLNLSGNQDIFFSSFEYLQSQPQLTYLDISNTMQFVPEAEEANAEFIHELFYKLPNLESLLMQSNQLEDISFQWIVPITPLPMLQQLQCLNLNNNSIGRSIQSISSFKHLRELHLKRNPAQNASSLLKLLPLLPELNCLEIFPRSNDVLSISNFLSKTNINSLYCNNQGLSQASAEALSNNPRLTTLEIAPSIRNKNYEDPWPLAFLTNLTLRNVTIAYPSQHLDWPIRAPFLAFITGQSSGFKSPLNLCLSEYLPSLGQRNQAFQRDALSTVNAQLWAHIKIEHLSRIILTYFGVVEVDTEEQERRKEEFISFKKDKEDLYLRRADLLGQQLRCIYEALFILRASNGDGLNSFSYEMGRLSNKSPELFKGHIAKTTLKIYEIVLNQCASVNANMHDKRSITTTMIYTAHTRYRFFYRPTEDQKKLIAEKIHQMPEDKGMPPLPEGRSGFGFD